MKCPDLKCNGRLGVTNTYSCGERGAMQRRQCMKCGLTVTTEVVVVNIDPGPGQGAAALARKKREAPDE